MDGVICLIMMVISPVNNKEWKEFVIEDLFVVKSGIRLTKKNMKVGNLPFIGATDRNNGVTNFVSNINDSLDYNVLGVNYNGSVVENFYHPYSAVFSDDVKRLSLRKVEGNKYVYLFIKTMILQQKNKYMYAYKFNAKRMNRQKIMLPVDGVSEPDWDYMEHLGRSIYYKQNRDILGYLVKKMDALEEEVKNKILSENIEWGLWTIGRLFNTKRVSGRTFESYDKGCFPYITTSSQRNGVNGFVRAVEEDISFRNSLTISPIDGTVFYHSFDFVGRGGAGSSIITLTNKYLNKYTGLFIKTAIECSSRAKASYGVQLNGDRLKATKFKLPINKEGNPDWDYMELYMKKIEYEKLKKLVDYLQRKVAGCVIDS